MLGKQPFVFLKGVNKTNKGANISDPNKSIKLENKQYRMPCR